MNAQTGLCPRCATPLPPDAPKGLCPECLLCGGFESGVAIEPRAVTGGSRRRASAAADPLDEVAFGVPHNLRDFGDYELLEEIAAGGMGVVFKARQLSLNRIVAVKMIRAGQLARADDIRRFRTEAEAAANLKHPHIVAIHEVGEHEGRHYFSMDFIAGRNLAESVRDRPLEPKRAARLMQTIAEAIAYAHGRGVLHRDLKPSNVMIDADDQPHVTDFGLAKLFDVAPASSPAPARTPTPQDLTYTGAVLGSPSYMSPEQAQGRGDLISVRSDVYALGAMLYELLTTRPPFLAATPLQTMKLVAESDPMAPRTLNPAVPRDLETICLKCLQKDPERRYASAEDLGEDLARWQRREPICARPGTVWEHAVKWTRRHPARAALVALSVVAPAIIIALLLVMGTKLADERTVAVEQKRQAVLAATRAEAGEQAARERAYAADIYAAFKALTADDLALARRLMDEHRPDRKTTDSPISEGGGPREGEPISTGETQPDLRGFEWRVLWERTRGQETFALTNLARPAQCLVFAPDGRTLVSAADDGIHLWDIAERRYLGLFPGPDPGPTRRVSVAVEDVRPMLDASPAVIEHLEAHPTVLDYLDALGHTNRTRTVASLAFTPDGNHLLVGSRDYVRSWNFATRAFEFAIPEQEATVAAPAVGDLFVVANNQRITPDDDAPSAHRQSAAVYSFARRRMVAALPGYGQHVVISPDGQSVAAVSQTNGAVLWWPATGEIMRLAHHPWHNDPRRGILLKFSPDGKTLFIRSETRRPAMLWNVAERRIAAYLRGERTRARDIQFSAVAWSPDGRFLAGGGDNQNIGLWPVSPRDIPGTALDGPPFLLPQSVLHGHEAAITALAFTPDGRGLASAANDHSIRYWAIPDAPVAVPKADPDTMHEFALDPETACVVARAGGKLTLWDPRHDYASRALPGSERHFHAGFLAHGQGFVAVEFATNGVPIYVEFRRLPEGDVRLRREILPAPRELQARGDPTKLHLTASPDGRWLAVPQLSGDGAKDVHVFDLDTGQFITRLPGEPDWGLRASPDSRWLVRREHSGGMNRFIIYDAKTWQPAHKISFRSAGNDIGAASIDPSSRFLATGSTGENSIRVWDLLTGRLVGQCNGNVHGWHPVWTPDSRTLVVRDSGSLRLWSTVVFRELAALPAEWHNTHLPLGFTADGRTLVLHTLNRTVVKWSPPALAEIDRLP